MDTKQSPQGHIHPLEHMMTDIVSVCTDLGFTIAYGPEREDGWHNFDALNIPPDHPARDMQDTFFMQHDPTQVLRTHTSSVQIRYMETGVQPPFAVIAPGKVYRQEATDATHEVQFHQIEGLYVSDDASLAQLRGTLRHILTHIFGTDVTMRFRPGYFPFVEPGVEVDMQFQGQWLEVLGAGMVHPHVLENVGIDPHTYRGFAFGIGVDRLTMMRHDIPDVRLLYTGDLRVVNQF